MTDRQHAVIAGTGRAGTSFLVAFLQACGLEAGDGGGWHDRARAGFEHHLDAESDLPYVVKDPWLFAYCDQLDLERFRIDALLIPMRDLMLAAQSRVHQERLAVLDTWLGTTENNQIAGLTPGGALYSLDVVDQARILGIGFHKLLHWAVANELPIYLLSFPRLVEDVDYLTRVLWPWLGEHCTVDAARRAFAETAAASAVRMRPKAGEDGGGFPLGPAGPDPTELERAALLEGRNELLAENRRLLAEERRLSEELRSIESSGSYRLLAPLRAVREFLATRRR